MGGKVDVESCPGRGSVFSLELSLTVDDPVGSTLLSAGEWCHKRLLVVDDNAAARGQIVELLRTFLLHVDEADRISAAIEMIADQDREGHPFDVVLIDWKMPKSTGLRRQNKYGYSPCVGIRQAWY